MTDALKRVEQYKQIIEDLHGAHAMIRDEFEAYAIRDKQDFGALAPEPEERAELWALDLIGHNIDQIRIGLDRLKAVVEGDLE